MKIWVVQTGEPLHIDGGNPRPMRAMNLSDRLVERGHEVVIWSSSFYHQEKIHRSKEFKEISVSDRLTVKLIPSRGYSRNIGLGRLIDHAQLAFNMNRILGDTSESKPDLAFIGFPPIELASYMLSWLTKRGCPTILDIKDQWPSLFLEPFPNKLKPFVQFCLSPYFFLARSAMKRATVVTTMSKGYLDWMYRFSDRKRTNIDQVIPLTGPRREHSVTQINEGREWLRSIGVDASHDRRFVFIGSFMSVFDFTPVRDAAKKMLESDIDCQFVICGDGGSSNELHELMSGLDNVLLPGWIDSSQMVALAQVSRGAIIPYKNIENFTANLPNKVIDSLGLGLPIITQLEGELKKLIEQENVGLFSDGSEIDMYSNLIELLEDRKKVTEISERCLSLYERDFEHQTVYDRFVDLIEKTVSDSDSA
ncbi:MAG: hypothetical protein CMI56_01525 [Parcubacteria group bacterium]|nr:hypothetical protein [Parcubacteria group bacterium]